ncbi:MAG: dihydroorotase [Thermodesulfobacteriota bacterium]|nr:dihydroorotase [Thermodesulfobacteriota bacterium]
MITILQNGRLIDPVTGVDETGDLWIKDGFIIPAQEKIPENSQYFDLQGKWIVPGLIDMHVHLREPGEEYKETVESGTRAAAAGGFTAVACMPNTIPVNDCASVTQLILAAAESKGYAKVYPVGAISKGSQGTGLAEYGELKAAGAVAVTDDGLPVLDSQLMRRAMEYAGSHELLLMSHSEEIALSRNGSMNEGVVSTRLGLRGIPVAAEAIMVYREIALAELTGQRTHIAHVSTAAATELIAQAKARGVQITAETTPHYFTLTEEAVGDYNTNAKMNPPLRTEEDRQAIRKGLQDGTFDAIATDHAPHSVIEKELEFDQAANGIIGLETSLPLSLGLVRDGVIDAMRMVELMSSSPARILKVDGGTLAVGTAADVTVIDPDKEFVFTKESILSKGKNSPFIDWTLQGKAVLTIMDGRITHNELS